MKLWAHRGCSQRYPENTLSAFAAAEKLEKLTGIELDVQLTRDGQLVVFHDERLERTTDGTGLLCDAALAELKRLRIAAGEEKTEQIPTLGETLDLLEPRLRSGLLLNIELKNSVVPNEGMEEMLVDLIHRRGLQRAVVYSSFYARSLERLRELDPAAELGILDIRASDCLYKLRGGCGANALHPFWRDIDVPVSQLGDCPVRAWMTGHLYPEKPTGNKLDFSLLEQKGITDLILNEPERYLGGDAGLL